MFRRSKSTSNVPQQKGDAPKRSKSSTRGRPVGLRASLGMSADVSFSSLRSFSNSPFPSPGGASTEGAAAWTPPPFGFGPSFLRQLISTAMPQYVIDYLIAKFNASDNEAGQKSADMQLKERFETTEEIDDNFAKIETELQNLRVKKVQQNKEIYELRKANERIRKEMNVSQRKIHATHFSRWQQETNATKILRWTEERNKLAETVEKKKAAGKDLQNVIKKQEHSIEEKRKLLQKIDSLKMSVKMKRYKIQKMENLKRNYEQQHAVIKKEVEDTVKSLNSTLNILADLEPDLRVLHLDETKIETADFDLHIRAANREIIMFRDQFEQQIEYIKLSIAQVEHEINTVEDSVKSCRISLRSISDIGISLSKLVKVWSERNENMVRKRNFEIERFNGHMESLNEQDGDAEELKSQCDITTIIKEENEASFEEKKKNYVQLYVDFRDIVQHSVAQMNRIIFQISDVVEGKLALVEPFEVEKKVLDDGKE